MKTLYELSKEVCELFDAIEAHAEENGGEVPADLDAKIEKTGLEREQKIAAICSIYKELVGRSGILAAEAEKLAARAKTQANQAKALKEYLARNLLEGEKFEVGPHRVGWREASSVELMPNITVEEIPELYQRRKIEFAASDAKRAIANGEDLWFAQIVKRKHIQIG